MTTATTRRARARRLLGVVALVLASCSRFDAHRVVADVPPDIVLLAVALEVDGTLQISGLAERHLDHFDHVVDDAPEGTRVHILGYREATLARYDLPDVLTLRGTALRVAVPGEPVLPPPDLQQTALIGSTDAAVSSTAIVRLTADWLACPVLSQPSATVDLSCFGYYCDARVSQRGCVLTYEAPSCTAQGALTATLDRAGNASFAAHDDFVGCSNDPSTPAMAAVCTGPGGALCTWKTREPRRAAALATRTVRLERPIEVPPPELRFNTGLVHGVAVRGARAYSIGAAGRVMLRGACSFGSRMHVVDTVRASTIAAVDIPCLQQLVSDPVGNGVLAVSGGAEPRLLRLDADGRELHSISLGSQSPDYLTGDLAVSVRSNTAAVLFRRPAANDPYPARVVLVRLDTLSSSIAAARTFASASEVLGFLDDGRVVVPDNANVAWYLDPLTGGAQEGPGLDDCTQSSARAFVMEGRRAVFVVRSQQDSVSTLDLDAGEASCRRAVFPYAQLQPSAIGRLPGAAQRWLVALDDDRDGPGPSGSVIAIVDDAEWAYTPEVLELGDGPHIDMEADDRGRVWTSEPWSGSLVELSLER